MVTDPDNTGRPDFQTRGGRSHLRSGFAAARLYTPGQRAQVEVWALDHGRGLRALGMSGLTRRRVPARVRSDGNAAPSQGHRHLRPPEPARRQAGLSPRHSPHPGLCVGGGGTAIPNGRAARSATDAGRGPLAPGVIEGDDPWPPGAANGCGADRPYPEPSCCNRRPAADRGITGSSAGGGHPRTGESTPAIWGNSCGGLGDGRAWGVRIAWSPERRRRWKTGGGSSRHCRCWGRKPFLVLNGDVWTDYSFARLPARAGLAIWCCEQSAAPPQGDFALRTMGGSSEYGARRLTFSGISVLRRSCSPAAAPGRFPARSTPRRAMATGAVTGEQYAGRSGGTCTPQRLEELGTDHDHSNARLIPAPVLARSPWVLRIASILSIAMWKSS